MKKKSKNKFTVEEIVKFVKDETKNPTIEGQLLRRKLIRELYKQLGAPKEEDFKSEFDIAGRYWKKVPGYTNDIDVRTERYMEIENGAPTRWCVARPSMTKVNIVEDYTRAGWNCTVQAYNVMCHKYVKHPKHKNVWVRFYSSRDCNKYEYIIEENENE